MGMVGIGGRVGVQRYQKPTEEGERAEEQSVVRMMALTVIMESFLVTKINASIFI